MWNQLSTPVQSLPDISALVVPDNVSRDEWLKYLIFMHQNGSKVNANEYHKSYPHPPFIAATPCHGGKIHEFNHSFQLGLYEWKWSDPQMDGVFPKWNISNRTVLTPYYPDGVWLDELVIEELPYKLRREAYSHGICSECFDHILEQRRK